MKLLIAEIAATSWRDWLATVVELAGVVITVSAIAVISMASAPT